MAARWSKSGRRGAMAAEQVSQALAVAAPAPKSRRRYAETAKIAAAIERLNLSFAMVKVGGRCSVICEERAPDGRSVIELMPISDFKIWHANEQYRARSGKYEGVGALWVGHKLRRSYSNLVFAPEGAPEGAYNLWRGFTVVPSDRDPWKACPTFMDHLRTNVARGDEALFNWVCAWFAHMVQRPAERIGTALVLRGRQGTGKTKVGQVIGSLFPDHWVLVASARYLVGQFNAHLAACLLLQADEGFWAGDKQAEGLLKGLVTGSEQMIERKGVDPIKTRNLVRLLVTSNADWVIPAGFEERRFAVLDLGEAAMQNHGYFAAVDAEMSTGGREALLGWLLRFDLAAADVRHIPKTEALRDQKIASMRPEVAWWYGRLRHGAPTASRDEWGDDPVQTTALYASYVAFCDLKGERHRLTDDQLGHALRKLVPGRLERTRPWFAEADDQGLPRRRRAWCYRLPPLDDCRRHFDELLGQDADWGDEAGDRPPMA